MVVWGNAKLLALLIRLSVPEGSSIRSLDCVYSLNTAFFLIIGWQVGLLIALISDSLGESASKPYILLLRDAGLILFICMVGLKGIISFCLLKREILLCTEGEFSGETLGDTFFRDGRWLAGFSSSSYSSSFILASFLTCFRKPRSYSSVSPSLSSSSVSCSHFICDWVMLLLLVFASLLVPNFFYSASNI